MSECCNEYNCRRHKPILIRMTPFSRRFVAVTTYTVQGDLVSASSGGKHDVHEGVLLAVAEFLSGRTEYDAAAEFLRSVARQPGRTTDAV